MSKGFYYIVVTIGDSKYFINKDMDYTDNFDDVMKFDNEEQARDHIKRHLSDKAAKPIPFIVQH